MQASPTPTLAAFGIVLNPDAFRSDRLTLTPEVVTAIEDALHKALVDRHGDTPAGDLSRNMHITVAVRAAVTLMRAHKYAAVAHLADVADPLLRLVRLKTMSLQFLRAFDDLTREIDRLEARADLPDEARNFLFTLRLKNVHSGLQVRPCDHAVFMADIPDTWEEALTALSGPATVDDPHPRLDPLIPGLIALRNNPADRPEDFRRRLIWGQNMQIYCRFLHRFSRQFRDQTQEAPGIQKLLHINRGLNDALLRDDLTRLHAAAATRSVLLSAAHAGIPEVDVHIRGQIDLPEIKVAANADTALEDGRPLRLGTHGDFQTDFLKLVKIVKKSPHLIRIFPDGGKGGDQLEFDLLGRKIRLGQGAATLAWHARAATFFTGTRWEGSKIQVYLREGPVADKDMGRAAFDQAFYAFYIDCLKEIVLGAPEDMAGMGGFWPSLAAK